MNLIQPKELYPGLEVLMPCGFPCRIWQPQPTGKGDFEFRFKPWNFVPVRIGLNRPQQTDDLQVLLTLLWVHLPYAVAEHRDVPSYDKTILRPWFDTREVDIFRPVEKEYLSARNRETAQRLKAERRGAGPPPYGYRYSQSPRRRRVLVKDREQRRIGREIVRLRDVGWCWSEISERVQAYVKRCTSEDHDMTSPAFSARRTWSQAACKGTYEKEKRLVELEPQGIDPLDHRAGLQRS